MTLRRRRGDGEVAMSTSGHRRRFRFGCFLANFHQSSCKISGCEDSPWEVGGETKRNETTNKAKRNEKQNETQHEKHCLGRFLRGTFFPAFVSVHDDFVSSSFLVQVADMFTCNFQFSRRPCGAIFWANLTQYSSSSP